MAADVTIFAALFAGLLSFLSPCVLPLVPPYLVYLAGTSLERFADDEPRPRVRWETVGAACLFVAGFSTVFVALGGTFAVPCDLPEEKPTADIDWDRWLGPARAEPDSAMRRGIRSVRIGARA